MDLFDIVTYALKTGRSSLLTQITNEPDFDVNTPMRHGLPFLCWAIRTNNRDVVAFVLRHPERNINIQCDHGTPLHMAASHDRQEIARSLLACDDLDINAVDRFGQTALMIAASRANLMMVQLLSSQPGIDLHRTAIWDDQPETASERAERYSRAADRRSCHSYQAVARYLKSVSPPIA